VEIIASKAEQRISLEALLVASGLLSPNNVLVTTKLANINVT
jgi:hypothetical protein